MVDARRLTATAAQWAESVHGLSDVLWIDTALLIIICLLVGFVVYRMMCPPAGESAAAALDARARSCAARCGGTRPMAEIG